MSTYIQHLSIVCVMLDGAEFTVDADLRGSTAIVHGIKLAGKWWHADRVLSCDFTEELEAAIDAMPLNADGDVPSSYYRNAA